MSFVENSVELIVRMNDQELEKIHVFPGLIILPRIGDHYRLKAISRSNSSKSKHEDFMQITGVEVQHTLIDDPAERPSSRLKQRIIIDGLSMAM